MKEIAISHTANSEKNIIFRTKYSLLFKIVYKIISRYYKNKMFIWDKTGKIKWILKKKYK
jgi:hypothetical protein